MRADILLETGRDLDSRRLAMQDLHRAQSAAPGTALASLAKGRLAWISREFDRAIDLYDLAIEKDARLFDAYLARAAARLLLQNHTGALRDANLAAGMDPTSSRALTLRAHARFFATNDRLGTRAALLRALELNPVNGPAFALRAYARLLRDSAGTITSKPEVVARSEKDARQALALDPTLPLAHLALAELLMSKGDLEAAIASAGKAVECSYKKSEPYLVRARLRMRDGDLDHGFLDLEQVLQLEPDHARAMTMKASILTVRRDFDQARTLLERAIELDRTLAPAYHARGRLSLMGRPRNYRKAIQDFSEAIGLVPTYADAYFYRGVAYHDQQRYEDAIQDLKQAYELRRQGKTRGVPSVYNLFDLHMVRGHCHWGRSEWKAALEDYDQYLELAPVGSLGIARVRKRKRACEAKLAGN